MRWCDTWERERSVHSFSQMAALVLSEQILESWCKNGMPHLKWRKTKQHPSRVSFGCGIRLGSTYTLLHECIIVHHTISDMSFLPVTLPSKSVPHSLDNPGARTPRNRNVTSWQMCEDNKTRHGRLGALAACANGYRTSQEHGSIDVRKEVCHLVYHKLWHHKQCVPL